METFFYFYSVPLLGLSKQDKSDSLNVNSNTQNKTTCTKGGYPYLHKLIWKRCFSPAEMLPGLSRSAFLSLSVPSCGQTGGHVKLQLRWVCNSTTIAQKLKKKKLLLIYMIFDFCH